MGDVLDPGHATMVDVIPDQEVGGVAMGNINTLPAGMNSQHGPSIPDYASGVASAQALQDYIKALLAAKPYSELPSYATLLNRGAIYLGSTGDISLTSIVIDPGLSVESSGNSATVIIITNPEGNLADVTFEGNINYDGKHSVVIIAKNITLSHTVSIVNAVLIASEKFNTGTNPDDGPDVPLKIKGNIVAHGGIVQERVRGDLDHARPSVLMVFDPKAYFDAMSLMNVKDVEYKVVE